MASSRPSFPAPSEPNLKRLGVGSGSGSERPIRSQLVVAAVAVMLVVAIPLYLFRRPAGEGVAKRNENTTATRGLIRSTLDAGVPNAEVRLAPPQRVKCSVSSTRQGNEGSLCDRLVVLEQALKKAILANTECAPRTGKQGTINYVLTVDFNRNRLNVFPGASGEWKGPQAKAAAKCVKRSLPEVAWDTLPHRYRYYAIAIMATYPPPDPLEVPPRFE